MPAGRPTKYSQKVKKQIKSLVELGLTDAQVAKGIGITEQTLNNWKIKHPTFFESLKDWKAIADRKVEKSLRDRALGYSHPEDKFFVIDGKVITKGTIKHYPPDATSMIFWLKNRQPEKWSDRREMDVNVKTVDDIVKDLESEE